MPNYLLTGAGFSRNWGGWLASEAFEYLLGCRDVDGALRHKLWTNKNRGNGFEDTLGELQQTYELNHDITIKNQLDTLISALAGMFNAMTQAFLQIPFEPSTRLQLSIASFLERFDAIFTLNQDTLLELHYLHTVVGRSRWSKAASPGIKPVNLHTTGLPMDRAAPSQPDPSAFSLTGGIQPYIKLHGSANWIGGPTSGRMLIMGSNKQVSIRQFPLLQFYHAEFERMLNVGASRLMVIGYGFGDKHINDIIGGAVDRGLKLFIVDPAGVDVIDKSKPAPIKVPDAYFEKVAPSIIGASRRPFLSTFSTDIVEFNKLSGFFAGILPRLAPWQQPHRVTTDLERTFNVERNAKPSCANHRRTVSPRGEEH